MKKLSRINFNHATKEIIITKAFETEANVIGSAATTAQIAKSLNR